MAIIRVQKNKNYTIMSNIHLRDKRISLKAKGLMSVCLSLPDDWDYSIAGLASISKESGDTIKTALSELKKYGYVTVKKLYPKVGNQRIDYEYTIIENPNSQEGYFQLLEIQPLESQAIENPTQLNTNQLNTKEIITKDNKYISKQEVGNPVNRKQIKHKYGEYQHVLLTDEELQKIKDQFSDWEQRIKALDEGIELKGYKYKSHYLAILKWAKNDIKRGNSHIHIDIPEYMKEQKINGIPEQEKASEEQIKELMELQRKMRERRNN